MIRVKVCGITNLKDALLVSEMGAYALGFIFYKGSKRYIEPLKAKEIISKLPPFIIKVGVFVNEKEEDVIKITETCGLDRIQVLDDDFKIYKKLSSEKIIRAIRIKDIKDIETVNKSTYFPLLDKYSDKALGGTGEAFDWDLLQHIRRDYILAGGININNLALAIKYKPYALDVSSGLEKEPGIKDEKKVFEFFNFLRQNHF